MSVTIRLAKIGKRHAPSYKVVVANTRDKRNGRFLEILGYYNPTKNPEEFKINSALYEEWKGKGALVSEAVEKLVAGEYTYVKYEPNKKKEEESKETPKVEEASVEKAEETNESEETKAE